MANGFTNRLTIRGATDTVERAAEAIADPLDADRLVAFDRILPEQEGLEGRSLREWRETHWGVPYTPSFVSVEHELLDRPAPDGERVYFFSSDGDAPLPLLVSFATQHPELEIELVYHEPADGVAGFARFAGGRPLEARRLYKPEECYALLAAVWPDELEFWQ